MLFIYLLQDDPVFGERVRYLRKRSLERGDEICTSALALGEILAGVYRDKTPAEAARVRDGLLRAGVRILPFDLAASDRFGSLRAKFRRSAADTIHLACAAVAGVDLFLTGDEGLLKLQIDGIKFIAGINTDLL
jgi:predicted nucleic acid-binding protein